MGYLLYDAYGGVLNSTIPTTLTTALAGQGALPDPATGLVHLGGGRWYDPALGRPLQPNPIGGPPAVPQALNRYAATSLGPPGVAEAQMGYQPGVVEKGLFKTGLTYLANQGRQALVTQLTTSRPTGWVNLTVRGLRGTFPASLSGLSLVETYEGMTLGEGLACLFGCGDAGLRLRLFGTAVRDTIRRGLGLQPVWETRAGRVFRPEVDDLTQVEVLAAHAEKRAILSGTSGFLLKHGIGLGWAVGLNFAVQYGFDMGNPYLTEPQRWTRGGVAVLGGGIFGYALAAGAASAWGGPAGIAVGFTWGLIWFGAVQPVIFQNPTFAPSRRLAPLP
ncbi:MAG: hypothetical protein AB1801_04390 [Chloroflexota bacterium]